ALDEGPVTTPNAELKGVRVFVVEDEGAVLLLVEDILAEMGCEVTASAGRLAEATELAGRVAADVAVLDVNPAGEPVYPVAETLVARQVPVVFATGYGLSGVPESWREWPVLHKPYRKDDLAVAIAGALGKAGR